MPLPRRGEQQLPADRRPKAWPGAGPFLTVPPELSLPGEVVPSPPLEVAKTPQAKARSNLARSQR